MTESLFKYGEFENVSLTPDELGKLKARFGEKQAVEMVDELSEYKKARGRKYKSDYAALLQWFRRLPQGQKLTGSNHGAFERFVRKGK